MLSLVNIIKNLNGLKSCINSFRHYLKLIKRQQGPKGMPDQEISVQNKDKQPKNLKKFKNFLLNFLNFQIKINFEKNFLK